MALTGEFSTANPAVWRQQATVMLYSEPTDCEAYADADLLLRPSMKANPPKLESAHLEGLAFDGSYGSSGEDDSRLYCRA